MRTLVLLVLLFTSLPGLTKDAKQQFFAHLQSLCGKTLHGHSTFPADPQDSFANKLLVLNFADCKANVIKVPFAVAADTSRTWVIRYIDNELSLKHDHRHADGSPHDLTMYGGIATSDGTQFQQSFPADKETRAMLPEATTNIWQISINPDSGEVTYYLTRHGKPRFKAVFKVVD
ncbi:hypothetical protein ACUR5C_15780 [Aliikangiella sp. IMCC44653]